MNPQRLKPIQRLAQDKEDAQARELAERERALQTQEQRLADLRRFAAEYAALPAGARTSAALLSNRRAFVEKLDSAVNQQQRHVDNARGNCDVERARLMLASREVRVLDKLAASYNAQERKETERRAQRELDDHAARTFRRKDGE